MAGFINGLTKVYKARLLLRWISLLTGNGKIYDLLNMWPFWATTILIRGWATECLGDFGPNIFVKHFMEKDIKVKYLPRHLVRHFHERQ